MSYRYDMDVQLFECLLLNTAYQTDVTTDVTDGTTSHSTVTLLSEASYCRIAVSAFAQEHCIGTVELPALVGAKTGRDTFGDMAEPSGGMAEPCGCAHAASHLLAPLGALLGCA